MRTRRKISLFSLFQNRVGLPRESGYEHNQMFFLVGRWCCWTAHTGFLLPLRFECHTTSASSTRSFALLNECWMTRTTRTRVPPAADGGTTARGFGPFPRQNTEHSVQRPSVLPCLVTHLSKNHFYLVCVCVFVILFPFSFYHWTR